MVLLLLAVLLVPALAEYQINLEPWDTGSTGGLAENVVNVLLIGADAWEDVRDEGRSDTMIVCSYHRDTGEVRLLSLARDLLVNIPNRGGTNRLNAAHSFGGPILLMKTINQTFSLNIERYVSLNIHGLRRILDAMGGLSITITPGEAREVNRMIGIEFPHEENPPCPSGDCVLSGLQAMTYARIRDLDSDFGRMARQRRVISAIAQQVSKLDGDQRMAFLQACLMNTSTNLSTEEILSMSLSALTHGITGMRVETLPRRGTYAFDEYKGMSVLLSEEKLLANDAKAFLYGD
ncbi:MAG: LCP family protein [Clostridiales bacterium]|nr:LCP family protein [Clostridiales bacterium]